MKLLPLTKQLETGKKTSQDLVSTALSLIESADGQGKTIFRETRPDLALAEARAWDAQRTAKDQALPLAGIPISVKDNVSVAGYKRQAASLALSDCQPEETDAPFVAKLKALGLVSVGMTNMSEFAYSGLGTNTHFGTPLSDQATGRISGGSSSGAAASVKDGIVPLAVGTDTSGSVRIPAAMCGLAGYRPSQERYSSEMTIPLATSFDSVGTIANSPECLAYLDALLTQEESEAPAPEALRLLVPNETLEEVDPRLLDSFHRYVERLTRAGVQVVFRDVPELIETRECVGAAQIVTYEAFQWHKELLPRRRDQYDPRVAMRFDDAESLSAENYTSGLKQLGEIRQRLDQILEGFDGFLAPTVPIQPPTLAELAEEDVYLRLNAMSFRNTSIANHLDLPSVCFPTEEIDGARGSAMLIGTRQSDAMTLSIATTLSKFSGE